ncbi:MAG: NAD(P)-binding domain-containing protein [Gemmatimonadaceae bacterium]|nr:NAD(P)-binding domain-containing protein [Gemmatimonadaceae bacterium]
MQPHGAPIRTERYHTIVIGAGQAGLAVGYELQRREDDFVILEASSRIGESWRRRWDSLCLFTSAAHSGLPDLPFPSVPSRFPTKDEVADYLEQYAARFDLPLRLDTPVKSLTRVAGRYAVQTAAVTYEASNVIVATGMQQSPVIPAIANRLSSRIHQLHSVEYVNPHLLPAGPALVVGAGYSGVQIAIELARFRPVWLAGRSRGHIPRRVLGRDIHDWTWPLLSRLTVDTRAGRALRHRVRRGEPIVGISARHIAAVGASRVGRVSTVLDGYPVCDDAPIPADVVVWATGYRPDFSWIRLPVLGLDSSPRHECGVVRESLGLYFVGLCFQTSYMSALIGGVGRDAAHIAERIAGRASVAVNGVRRRASW